MTAAELEEFAGELGFDVVGAAPAEAYVETEQAIHERKARGLFADMRFTMAQPEVSCHPEALLPGARSVISAAYCYYAQEPLLTAGVGFYGKNTMLITRRHGSWVVLGTLVTTAEVEASSPLELDCGSCTLCIEACPTGALDEPGVVDSTRCLSYWTQAAEPIPVDYREELGAQVYGCDICQDVCPWNRGVEKRRAGYPPGLDATPHVRLADWLSRDASALVEEYDRLYVPKNDPRYLRRNALVALGNTGGPEDVPLAETFLDDEDELLREQAAWAVARIEERHAR